MYWFKLMRNSAATSGAGNFYVIFKREKVKPELGDVWLGRWAKLEQYFHGLWQHWMRRSTTNEPTRHQHQYLSPRSDLNATQQFTDKLSLETIICACTPQYRSPGGHPRHWALFFPAFVSPNCQLHAWLASWVYILSYVHGTSPDSCSGPIIWRVYSCVYSAYSAFTPSVHPIALFATIMSSSASSAVH